MLEVSLLGVGMPMVPRPEMDVVMVNGQNTKASNK